MCKTTQTSSTQNATPSTPNSTTAGIHHLGLSVPNINETASFFIDQLNFTIVGEKPDYPAIFVSDGTIMLTLWQIKDETQMATFDRKNNVGLHHFALRVANLETLESLHKQFSLIDDIQIEFAPEQLDQLPIHHMMCFIPGGIRLELITA